MKRFNLHVPFECKKIAKSGGALWDANDKTWYVVDPSLKELLELYPFFDMDVRRAIYMKVPDMSADIIKNFGTVIHKLPPKTKEFVSADLISDEEVAKTNARIADARASRDEEYEKLDPQSKVIYRSKRYAG